MYLQCSHPSARPAEVMSLTVCTYRIYGQVPTNASLLTERLAHVRLLTISIRLQHGAHAAVPKVLVEMCVELCSMTRERPKSASLQV